MSSAADGLALWSRSKVFCRKSVALGVISVGIAGFAVPDPSYKNDEMLCSKSKVDATYLEDGLHLRELGEWMLTCEHFDDKASNTPNIRLASV